MTFRIPFAGVSRLDGVGEDGIHLVWGLPGSAAWSVDGFDIQRRASRGREPNETCVDLTPPLMRALHADRHLSIPEADITYRDTTCPVGLPGMPDEAASGGEASRVCLDLSMRDEMPDRIDEDGLILTRDQENGASFEMIEIDGRRGLLFAQSIEIELTEKARLVELEAWLSADLVVVQTFGPGGDVVAEEEIGAVSDVVREITVAHDGISRVRLIADGGKGVLFRACRSQPPETCWRFDRPVGTQLPNPFAERGAEFTLRDFSGALEPAAQIQPMSGHVGLVLTRSLVVRLPADVSGATLRLAHSSSSPVIIGYDADGAKLFERPAQIPGGTSRLVSVAADRLRVIEVIAPQAETVLQSLCAFGAEPIGPGGPTRREACVVYDVRLRRPQQFASLGLGVGAAYMIGMSDGEAFAALDLTGPAPLEGRFDAPARGVDRILAYTRGPARTLRLCTEPFAGAGTQAAEWNGVPYILKNHQMPLRRIDPGLASTDDEWAKAQTHLLPTDAVPRGHFEEVSDYAAAVTAAALPHRASFLTARTRQGGGEPPIDVAAWPFLMSLTTDATWRRVLALGFLDAQGLTPGDAYDYRITGRFRRMDVEEDVFGFHTVPVGMRVPGRVSLGEIGLHMPLHGVIELEPLAGAGTVEAGRRGLKVKALPVGGVPALTITFDTPTDHVVLELEGGDSFEAPSLASQLAGGPDSFHGAFLGTGRETLTFPEPVDAIRIASPLRLFAVRLPRYAKGLDPEEPVERGSVIYNVRYEATPAPEAPAYLGTLNLQTAAPPPDPAPGPRRAPDNLGFALYWPPVPPSGSFTGHWPEDLDAAPPTEALFYRIDRRDATAGAPWEPLSDETGPTRFFASRGAPEVPAAIAWGSDLLTLFPARNRASAPVPTVARAEDALTVPQRGGPDPGTLFQYRIRSVDIIGRESAPRQGSVARLEKRRAPPLPSGPIDPDTPAALGEPQGVQARVLRAGEPGLSPQDLADLGAASNAIVLEWGWHANQRTEDPWATEFRVYLQDPPFDAVAGEVTGPPGLVAGEITVPVSFDRPVAADRMRDLVLYSNGFAFTILGHSGGLSTALRLRVPATRPAARPAPGPFTLRPPLDGSELDPAVWAERVAVVPLTAASAYRHVLPDRLSLSPVRLRHRLWLGVTAADAQSYRPDSRTSGAHAGRPGNESTVAATDVTGRHIGRPVLAAPPLLDDVPEIVTAEPLRGGIAHLLDLPGDLPPGLIAAGERVILEKLNLSAISSAIETTATGVRFAPPGGAAVDYSPAAPADRSALIAAVRAGQPGAIPGKYLRAILAAAGPAAEPLWEAAVGGTVPFGPALVTLPGDPARYVFRVRLADAAGRRSEAGAVTEHIYRIPDLAPGAVPVIEPGAVAGADVEVAFRVRARFDLTHVAVFLLTAPAGSDFGANTRQPAEMLRTPNLRGRYPNDGIRLRLADGRILAPTVLNLSGATSAPPDLLETATLSVGLGQQAALWAVSVNRDGAVSRAAGPALIGAAPEPPTVPALSVTRAGGVDTVTWPAQAQDVEAAVERSVDGGTNWSRVSGWLPPLAAPRSLTFAAEGGAQTRYRLALRTRTASADGPTVTPT